MKKNSASVKSTLSSNNPLGANVIDTPKQVLSKLRQLRREGVPHLDDLIIQIRDANGLR